MSNCLKVELGQDQQRLVKVKRLSIRERFLNRILGEARKLTIIVPGDNVNQISIVEEGEEYESNEAFS